MGNDFIKFFENYSGIKLTTYQKICLKFLVSKESLMIGGRMPCKKLIYNSMIEYSKALKMNFDIVTPKGIEEYRNGELVNIKKYKKKR